MDNKREWRRWGRIILSVIALVAIFLVTGLNDVFAALSHADVSLILVGIGLNVVTRLAAAERTYVISRGVGLPLNRWQTVESMFISNFWSLALPGLSAGSVITVYRYTRYGVSLADGFGVLGASRVIELAAFCAFGAAAFALSASAPNAEVTVLLSLVPLLAVRKMLLRNPTPDTIDRGFRPPGHLVHAGLRGLMKAETSVLARTPTGTSVLMAARRTG